MGPIQPSHTVAIWLVLFAISLAKSTGIDGKTVVCYWQSWSHKRPAPHKYTVDDIPVHLCTHVIYSYAKLDNFSNSLYLDNEFDKGSDGYVRFLGLRNRNPKVKLLLALGDRYGNDSAAWYQAVHDPSRRYHVAGMLHRLLTEYNFDGVHINWEVGSGRRGNDTDNLLAKFVWHLRATLMLRGNFIMSCGTVLSRRQGHNALLTKLAKYVDMVHVSAVSLSTGVVTFNGTTVSQGNGNALSAALSYDATIDGLKHLIKAGLPAKKILLEVRFYGIKVYPDPEGGQLTGQSAYRKQQNLVPYYEVCSLLRSGFPARWDEERMSLYLVLHHGDRVYYDDVNSVRKKVILARTLGLQGVVAWTVDMDNQEALFRGKNELLKGVIEGLKEDNNVEATVQTEQASSSPHEGDGTSVPVLPTTTETSDNANIASESTTEGGETSSDHTDDDHVVTTFTEAPAPASWEDTTSEARERKDHVTSTQSTFSPNGITTATSDFDIDNTSVSTVTSTYDRGSTNMEAVTSEIPTAVSRRGSTANSAEAGYDHTKSESVYTPTTRTPSAPHSQSEHASTGTDASASMYSTEKSVSTHISATASAEVNTSGVAEITHYATKSEPQFTTVLTTTDISYDLPTTRNGTVSEESTTNGETEATYDHENSESAFTKVGRGTATPSFGLETTTSPTRVAGTGYSSSDDVEHVTTEILLDVSEKSTTTHRTEATYGHENSKPAFTRGGRTTATLYYDMKTTSRRRDASTGYITSDNVGPVTTEMSFDVSEKSTTIDGREATYSHENSNPAFTRVGRMTATPNYEFETTSRRRDASTGYSSSDNVWPVTTEVSLDVSEKSTTIDGSEATYGHEISDPAFTTGERTTANPNDEFHTTSRRRDASTGYSSSDNVGPVTTEVSFHVSEKRTTFDGTEATYGHESSKPAFTREGRTTATPNYEFETTSRRRGASTGYSSSENVEAVTTEMPFDVSEKSTTIDGREATYGHEVSDPAFTRGGRTTATPIHEFHTTSRRRDTSTGYSNSDNVRPATTEMLDVSEKSTTIDGAEATLGLTTIESAESTTTRTDGSTRYGMGENAEALTTGTSKRFAFGTTDATYDHTNSERTSTREASMTNAPIVELDTTSSRAETSGGRGSTENIEASPTEISTPVSVTGVTSQVATAGRVNSELVSTPIIYMTTIPNLAQGRTSSVDIQPVTTEISAAPFGKASATQGATVSTDHKSGQSTISTIKTTPNFNTADFWSKTSETELTDHQASTDMTPLLVSTESSSASSTWFHRSWPEQVPEVTTSDFSTISADVSATSGSRTEQPPRTVTSAGSSTGYAEAGKVSSSTLSTGTDSGATTSPYSNYEFPFTPKTTASTVGQTYTQTLAGVAVDSLSPAYDGTGAGTTRGSRTQGEHYTESRNDSTMRVPASYNDKTTRAWLNDTSLGTTSFSTENPFTLQSFSTTELEQTETAVTPTEPSSITRFDTSSSRPYFLISPEKQCQSNGVRVLPHESDSEFYYRCYRGIALLRKCATGSRFNATTRKCSAQGGVPAIKGSPISQQVVQLLNKVASGEVSVGKDEKVGVDVNIKLNLGDRN